MSSPALPADLEIYLNSKPRAKEWMPELPGLHKLSKTEVSDDLEFIQAAAPDSMSQYLHSTSNPSTATQAISNESKGNKKSNKKPGAIVNNNPAPQSNPAVSQSGAAKSDPEVAVDSTAPFPRRFRLAFKLMNSVKQFDATKFTATQLRNELETLRNEVVQYEEAIIQARHEIELARRERNQLDSSYNLIREEYRASIEHVEACRVDHERTENELRMRLTQCSQENVDLGERLNQLRALEQEFQEKQWKIENLGVEVAAANRTIQMLESLVRSKPDSILPVLPQFGQFQSDQEQQKKLANLVLSIHTMEIIPEIQKIVAANPDFIDSIGRFTGILRQVEKDLAIYREKFAEAQVKIHEQNREIHQQMMQIDRMNKQHNELHQLIRQAESAVLDERQKLEQTLKHTALLTKQKEDQNITLNGYEERMKHFQQLLTAADVRADQANSFLSDIQRQLNIFKSGNRQLQLLANRLNQENKQLAAEKNAAMEELNDRLVKSMSSEQLAAHLNHTQHSLKEHYSKLTHQNNTLTDEKLSLELRVQQLEQQISKMIPRAEHESDIGKLADQIDEARKREGKCQEIVMAREKEIVEITAVVKDREEIIKQLEQSMQMQSNTIQMLAPQQFANANNNNNNNNNNSAENQNRSADPRSRPIGDEKKRKLDEMNNSPAENENSDENKKSRIGENTTQQNQSQSQPNEMNAESAAAVKEESTVIIQS